MKKHMKKQRDFSFGDSSVAIDYDTVLVPALFTPWADSLIDSFGEWEGCRVLDLATGTGIVAQKLASRVGPGGRVIGADINDEMLAQARKRCSESRGAVEFIVSAAHPLELEGSSVDVVVCQQGFQFFPDRPAAAAEIYRVLEPRGSVLLTTWCPVEECEYFGCICEALTRVGEPEMAELMRAPFDYMPADELKEHFSAAGFTQVRVDREIRDFRIGGGVDQGVATTYATPIGPKLRALPETQQARFRGELGKLLEDLQNGGNAMGKMVSNVLTASKPG